jgi:hypothetical protein
MGHTRLGSIPKSQKWIGVVANFTDSRSEISPATATLNITDVKNIAQKTIIAADVGLEKAVDDIGLRYTFFLLTQIVLAAKDNAWKSRLGEFGLQISEESTLFDLTTELHFAVDNFISKNGRSTDLSEMAQQAAGDAIISLADPIATTLFGNSGSDLQYAIKKLSSKKGFSVLGQKFFGHFLYRYLNFYLSRFSASYYGGGVFKEIGEVTNFNQNLKTHCLQSAWIVHDFSGQWFSKTSYQEGINLTNSSRFMYVALKKLRDELRQQKEEL